MRKGLLVYSATAIGNGEVEEIVAVMKSGWLGTEHFTEWSRDMNTLYQIAEIRNVLQRIIW